MCRHTDPPSPPYFYAACSCWSFCLVFFVSKQRTFFLLYHASTGLLHGMSFIFFSKLAYHIKAASVRVLEKRWSKGPAPVFSPAFNIGILPPLAKGARLFFKRMDGVVFYNTIPLHEKAPRKSLSSSKNLHSRYHRYAYTNLPPKSYMKFVLRYKLPSPLRFCQMSDPSPSDPTASIDRSMPRMFPRLGGDFLAKLPLH